MVGVQEGHVDVVQLLLGTGAVDPSLQKEVHLSLFAVLGFGVPFGRPKWHKLRVGGYMPY